MEAWELAAALLGSFVAGYLGAAVGLVLGTLRLPLLLVLAGSPSAGAGTNIAISAAAAATGGARHWRDGRVDRQVVLWMAPPSVVGAVVGGLYGDRLPERALLAGVSAVLAWQGIDLIARPFRERPRPTSSSARHADVAKGDASGAWHLNLAAGGAPRLEAAAAFGLAIGVVGGALGVILGTLRMPALLRAVRLPAATAVGTNLVVGFFLGVAGFAAHAARLDVE